jgi:hypothetical protein
MCTVVVLIAQVITLTLYRLSFQLRAIEQAYFESILCFSLHLHQKSLLSYRYRCSGNFVLFDELFTNFGFACTRTDIAIDDYSKTIGNEDLIEACSQGNVFGFEGYDETRGGK